MKEKLKAIWNKIPSFKQVGKSLDTSLQNTNDEVTTTVVHKTSYRKSESKSWFQETFRGDERKKLEAYMSASTQAEQDAIVATMKEDMV